MAIKIQGTTILDDNRNLLSGNTVTANEFVGGGINISNVDKIFHSRSAFESANIPPTVETWAVYHSGLLLYYKKDTLGTAIESANGVKGSPLGKATPQHWGYTSGAIADTSPTDATSFILSAYNFAKDVYFPSGSYGISNLVLTGSGGSFVLDTEAHIWAIKSPTREDHLSGYLIYQSPSGAIIADEDINEPPYRIRRSTGSSARVIETTLTASVDKGNIYLNMNSASGFTKGDYLEIKSTEYFIGVDGVSGWGDVTKGEFAQIYSVDGNTVKLATPTRDSYNSATTTVFKIVFNEGLKIKGGKWHGVGNANALLSSSESNGFVFFAYCKGGEFHPDIADNFSGSAVVYESCIDGLTTGIFSGPSAGDATNLFYRTDIGGNETDELRSKWAKAVTSVSSEKISITNATCYNLRRPFDATSTGSSIISRDCSQIGVTAHFCNNLISVHQCENFVATGNVGTCDKFILFRGKTCNISNNSCLITEPDPEQGLIRVGSAPETEYPESPNSGDLVFHGNIANSVHVVGAGISIRSGYDSLSVSGGKLGPCKNGVEVFGKISKNTNITGVTFQGPSTQDNNFCVVVASAAAGSSTVNAREVLENFRVENNIFNGAYRDGFLVLGDFSAAGAKGIVLKNNSIEEITRKVIDQVGNSPNTFGLSGVFAEPVVAKGNTVKIKGVDFLYHNSKIGSFSIIEEEILDVSNSGYHIVSRHRTSTAPTENNRTYLRGGAILYNNPISSSLGTICVSSGTLGSLSGVTGSISASSDTATLSSVVDVTVGSFITIVGAGLSSATRVIAVSGNTVTLSEAATTTVTNAVVSRTAPVFVDINNFKVLDDFITHQNDSNTNFGFPENDVFAVTTAGTERLRVNSSGLIVTGNIDASSLSVASNAIVTNLNADLLDGVQGSGYVNTTSNQTIAGIKTFSGDLVIDDKIAHSGDSDTAIRFPAVDVVTIETAGSERLRVDAAGNVGIGTTPSILLHLQGTESTAKLRLSSTGTGSTSILNSSSSPAIELTAAGMNSSVKYTPAIKFGSTDPQFTTVNPKFGAAIVGEASETYGLDTDGGMDIVFMTVPSNPGETAVSMTERMRISNTGLIEFKGLNGNVNIFASNPSEAPNISLYGNGNTTNAMSVINQLSGGQFRISVDPSNVFANSEIQMQVDSTTRMLVTNSGAIITGTIGMTSYQESVFAITDGTVSLNPNNGSIQTWTLGANRTPGQTGWNSGQSITLLIDDGAGYTITWTTLGVVWKTDGGIAPTLNTSGYTVIALWKVGSTIYGARVGDA